jgi:hypothetical protein
VNRRYVVLSVLTAAGIVGLALIMWTPAEDRLGTPEYFERLTGLPIRIREPVVYCRRESFPDISGVWMFHIGPESAKILLDPPASFRNHPRQLKYEQKRTLVRWLTGELRPEDQRMFDRVMTVVPFVEGGDCQGAYSAVHVAGDIHASIGQPSTHYSYQYKYAEMLEAVDFRIIDAQAGIIYELVAYH